MATNHLPNTAGIGRFFYNPTHLSFGTFFAIRVLMPNGGEGPGAVQIGCVAMAILDGYAAATPLHRGCYANFQNLFGAEPQSLP